MYNDFSLANILAKEDFKKLGNIVLTNPEFIPRVQQILVRDRYCNNPGTIIFIIDSIILETDPIDAALMVVKCKFLLILATIGKSGSNSLFVAGGTFKKESESKIGTFLNKFK